MIYRGMKRDRRVIYVIIYRFGGLLLPSLLSLLEVRGPLAGSFASPGRNVRGFNNALQMPPVMDAAEMPPDEGNPFPK